MIKMYKPCGKEMEVNENSLKFAFSLGWSDKKPVKKKAPKKPANKAE